MTILVMQHTPPGWIFHLVECVMLHRIRESKAMQATVDIIYAILWMQESAVLLANIVY